MFYVTFIAQRNSPINDAPPPYTPPLSDWYPAQPAAYQPPQTGYYGWMPPTNVFPDVPPGLIPRSVQFPRFIPIFIPF